MQAESPVQNEDQSWALSAQPDYRPESPFLPEPEYRNRHTNDLQPSIPTGGQANYLDAVETPFITQFELEDSESESLEMALHREIVEEIYDEEFEGAIADLINQVKGVHEDRFQGEIGRVSAEVEQQMWNYLAPLDNELTGAIDQLVEGLVQIDNESLTELQLDDYLESFEYETNFEEPEFEAFFKKVWKKVKKVAKKGLKVLKKLSPIHIVLGKLKKLVRPLLRRVLKFALNKIPARFRPLAKRLAQRFLKRALGEIDESEFDEETLSLEDLIEQSELEAADAGAAGPTPGMLSAEFDSLIAGYLVVGETFENDPAVVQYVEEASFEDEMAADTAAQAREKFIQEIGAAETEEEALAAVEHFIPAVLGALKLGIKIIGRRRVVNFLAKLVFKLIRRFVGRRTATPLSRALVDAGLRLVNLEAAEDLDYATGEVIADTVFETIDEFVTTVPEDVLEDDELTELYVNEAFDHAVARNFPPQMLRPTLRQTNASRGMWMMFPLGRRRKHYKKFTEIFDVQISEQMAKHVTSFGGISLHDFLKDQLGLATDKQPVKARLHLYEAIRGTSLSDISHLEKGVDGLGSRSRAAWMRFHPLTPQAASILIPKNVGLGRRNHSRFLDKRTRIAVGQRFYYLEVPGARVLKAPAAPAEKVGSRKPQPQAPVRASEVNVTLDFRSREIQIFNFMSEAQATELAQAIRRGQSRVAIGRALRSTLLTPLRTVISGGSGKHLRIKREVPSEEGVIPALAPILRFVGQVIAQKVTQFVTRHLLAELKRTGNAFGRDVVSAAEAPADGITVIFTLSSVGEVFDVFSKSTVKRMNALKRLRSAGVSGAMSLAVKPGFHSE